MYVIENRVAEINTTVIEFHDNFDNLLIDTNLRNLIEDNCTEVISAKYFSTLEEARKALPEIGVTKATAEVGNGNLRLVCFYPLLAECVMYDGDIVDIDEMETATPTIGNILLAVVEAVKEADGWY